MRKANGLLSMLLVLLLACSYATAAEVNLDGDDSKLTSVPGSAWWSSIVPVIGDPKIQECWRSLLGTESCVTSAFQSILAGRFDLNSECCAAVVALGENCVSKMFSFIPSSNLIPGLITSVCAPTAPAPADPKNSRKIPF